mmetsp:Transcript_94691/g.203317  ORF Transcript_94691/g.203317 Transcript_94691/m.203317 type:complete len:531 (-) Transcript_94691:58-1650(-)
MGGLVCRSLCRRESEEGDALDEISPERQRLQRSCPRGSPWAEHLVQEFFGVEANRKDRAYVNFMMWMSTSKFPRMIPGDRAVPFTVQPSPFVQGLKLLEPLEPNQINGQAQQQLLAALGGAKQVIVGSVRMGYGHHRIAYSALTWAIDMGMQPYLLDILSPDCVEADIVRNMDKQYSRMSRMAAQFGGIVDTFWGHMTLTGDMKMMRFFVALAQKIRPIMAGLPRDVPVISSHPIIGDIAMACGFKTVINLVFDNYPQYFVLVPGALNLVQSPSYFDKLLDMGVPARSLRLAGHWVSSDLCTHAVEDSEARMARCARTELPRRFLITVGGAGAQKEFLKDFLKALAGRLRERRLRLYINCGDHRHIADAVVQTLTSLSIEFDEVLTSAATEALCQREPLSALSEPIGYKPVTVLRFDNHFAAFRCTDLVIRIADVLVTKPSELAFFPVPKLHIRRVGAHEAFSALRSTELGDGTVECREVAHAIRKVEQLIEPCSSLFQLMNRSIIAAAAAKIYEGSRVACECALGNIPP